MADDGKIRARAIPEGRGCLYISLALVLIILIAFVVAARLRSPDSAPTASPAAVAPPTSPSPGE